MKILGIIAEFNPFHNGHKYMIDTCMKNTGADFCIIAMSGDFVQRGTPAIIGYRERAEMALRSGASMVLGLDSYTATGSAEYFAEGAVRLLDSLGAVDYLAFGTEEGEIGALERVSNILADEDDRYRELLGKNLAEGMSYPAAREKAVGEYGGCDSKVLKSPNNILAIEYLKALKRVGSRMKPVTLKREGSAYNSENTEGIFSSARSIRNLLEKEGMHDLSEFMPESAEKILAENFGKAFPLATDDFSTELGYALRMNENSLQEFYDLPSDLADRIKANLNRYENFTQFAETIKTKNRTYSSVCRALIHILLGMKKKDRDALRPRYARVIGYRKDAGGCISKISKEAEIPLIMRISDAEKFLDEDNLEYFRQEIRRESIYEMAAARKFKKEYINPYKIPLIKI